MRIRDVSLLLGACLIGLALPMCDARGETVLVFGQNAVTPPEFTATRNMGTTTLSATDLSVTITQLGSATESISAYFDFSATNVTAAVIVSGTILENFDGTFGIYGGKGQTGTDYLSGTFGDIITGSGTALSFSASTAGAASYLTFTSGVLSPLDLPLGMSLSFTNVSPSAGVTHNSLNSFSSNVSGDFSASSAPEPSSIILLGLAAVLGGGVYVRRRMRRVDGPLPSTSGAIPRCSGDIAISPID
jgi:PEP-CTERM motif